MFEKIISILAHDPSQSSILVFYAKRVREEKSVRMIGMLFIFLAFIIQFFAYINPPIQSSASSSNDLVNGGFNGASQAAAYCRGNVQDYGSILSYYGISCDRVANAQTITINSRGWNSNLWSMGRNDIGNLPGETPTAPINNTTYYVRYLWGWDSPGTSSNYQALNVTAPGGQTFLLLYNCANLVSVGFPQAKTQPAEVSANKTIDPGSPAANSLVKPGTNITFRISVNNSGGATTNLKIKDQSPKYLDFVSVDKGNSSGYIYDLANNQMIWNFDKLNAGISNQYVNITYKISSTAPNKSRVCNYATINGDNINPFNTNSVCFVVDNAAPKPTPTPNNCPYNNTIGINDPRCVPCSVNSSIIASDPNCKPCQKSISSTDSAACVIYSKAASNLTQNIKDANGTLAQPNDVIMYTLTAKNDGVEDIDNFIFQDNISYLLLYSKVIDLGGATLKNNSIVFPATSLSAGKTKSVTFKIQVDAIIPQTPTSSSDPFYYNLTMTNTYGNTVKINLPQSISKQVQNTSTNLPNTGPGQGIIIAFLIVSIVGYFFYRARLLSIESDIALKDNSLRSIK